MKNLPLSIAEARQASCQHNVFVYRGLEYWEGENTLGYMKRHPFDVYYCDHCLAIIAVERSMDELTIDPKTRASHNALLRNYSEYGK